MSNTKKITLASILATSVAVAACSQEPAQSPQAGQPLTCAQQDTEIVKFVQDKILSTWSFARTENYDAYRIKKIADGVFDPLIRTDVKYKPPIISLAQHLVGELNEQEIEIDLQETPDCKLKDATAAIKTVREMTAIEEIAYPRDRARATPLQAL